MPSVNDLEYAYLGSLGATGSLVDRRRQVYGTSQYSYYAALSGLANPTKYSLADHKLAYFRQQTGVAAGSLEDAKAAFFTTGGLPSAASLLQTAVANRDAASGVSIAWLGSSSTAGNVASTAGNRYVNQLTQRIRTKYPKANGTEHPTTVMTLAEAVATPPAVPGIHSINAAISGSRSGNQSGATPYINATSRAQLIGLGITLFGHMIGANDYGNGVDPATYQANLISEITQLLAGLPNSKHILYHSYPRFDPVALSTRVADWSAFRSALYAVAQTFPGKVAVVDTSVAWATIKGVTGAAGADPFDLIDPDEIHMNDAGHDYMTDLLEGLLGCAPTLLFSDGFGGAAGSLNNRVMDLAAGGSVAAPTWAETVPGRLLTDGSQIVNGTGASGFDYVPVTPANVRVAFKANGSVANNWFVYGRRTLTAGSFDGAMLILNALTVQLRQITGGATATLLGSQQTFPLGADVMAEFQGTMARLYVNGALVDSATLSIATATAFLGLAVGSASAGIAVDDLRVWQLP